MSVYELRKASQNYKNALANLNLDFFLLLFASSVIPNLLCLENKFKSLAPFWMGLLLSHLETGPNTPLYYYFVMMCFCQWRWIGKDMRITRKFRCICCLNMWEMRWEEEKLMLIQTNRRPRNIFRWFIWNHIKFCLQPDASVKPGLPKHSPVVIQPLLGFYWMCIATGMFKSCAACAKLNRIY